MPQGGGPAEPGPGLTDVSTDREQGGLQANIAIDRQAAARLGRASIQDINNALNNAFAQRQISTIYTQRNQYRVILEVDPRFQRDPSDLARIFVPGRDGVQVPLDSRDQDRRRRWRRWSSTTRGRFPAVTINYGLTADMTLDEAQAAIRAGDRRAAACRTRSAPRPPATPRPSAAGQHAGAAHHRRAARRLHRAGRALREPGAPDDHHLDPALGRASARWSRCGWPAWSCR